jgi:hypothetical protein
MYRSARGTYLAPARTMSMSVLFASIGLPALPAAASAAGGCHSWALLFPSVCSVCSVDCFGFPSAIAPRRSPECPWLKHNGLIWGY